MSFQTPITIAEALHSISRNEYVLPAIQREFVWQPEQIVRLFDSLMQDYPIGSFLFWNVDKDNVSQYKFYGCVLNYHQKLSPHCPEISLLPGYPVTAILDGQQRLTALNIALRGSHATKEPHKHWASEAAFPEKKLFINILSPAEENDAGLKYDFRFMTAARAASDNNAHWYPVANILNFRELHEVSLYLIDQKILDNKNALKTLTKLFNVVHNSKTISYYLERSPDLDKVLNVFIRTNSGGTTLSYSDLLLSVATAQWDQRDARKVIYDLVDDINRIGGGFSFSKDFVLKAGLMLAEIGSVGFKVTNFNRHNMLELALCWDDISRAIRLSVELASSFGITGQSLSANNALLPIAYWLYRNKAQPGYVTKASTQLDRKAIRGWLLRSLLKSGVWGSGLDSLLQAIRGVLRDHSDGFPADAIEVEMSRRGKALRFDDEEIDDLLDVEYREPRAYLMLTLLFPDIDATNLHHIDHIFPRTSFSRSRLSAEGVAAEKHDSLIDGVNRLANLQLLTESENLEKNAKHPALWLAERPEYPTTTSILIERNALEGVPISIKDVEEFWSARRRELLRRLKTALGTAAAV